MNQRRLTCVKFLGEMYNYRLVEDDVIFNALYMLITFGSNQKGEAAAVRLAADMTPPHALLLSRRVAKLCLTSAARLPRDASQ